MSNDDKRLLRTFQLAIEISFHTQFNQTDQVHDSNSKRQYNASLMNNIFDSLLQDSRISGQHASTFVLNSRSIRAHQIYGFQPNAVAIPIPHNIIKDFELSVDADSPQVNCFRADDKHTRGNLSNLLPSIHSALICLQPCALLQSKISTNDIETTKTDSMTGSQLLVLALPPLFTNNDEIDFREYSSQNKDNMEVPNVFDGSLSNDNRFKMLQKIVNEVNGEPMVRDNSSVIQVFPIHRIIFSDCMVHIDSIKSGFNAKDQSPPPKKKALNHPNTLNVSCSNSTESTKSSTELAWLSEQTSTKVKILPNPGVAVTESWHVKEKLGEVDVIRSAPELPLCPVCLYRIEPQRLGLPEPKQCHRCTKCCDLNDDNQATFCKNMEFLSPWRWPFRCRACHVVQDHLALSCVQPFGKKKLALTIGIRNKDVHNQLKCYHCGIEETLWVCLTCGVVGCGRYSHGHAKQHFREKCHPFSLELATQRIWDYKTSSFIHREDLLNCTSMQRMLGPINNVAYHGVGIEDIRCSGGSPNMFSRDGYPPKKAVMVGEEYEALLQSALEDQSQHYQDQISRLQADRAVQNIKKSEISEEKLMKVKTLENEISNLRFELDQMRRLLMEAQQKKSRFREKSKALLREQNVVNQLLDKIRKEALHEEERGEKLVESLEQEVSDLTTYLQMRQKVAQNQELSNAQIYGTSGKPKVAGRKKGFRKSRK